MTSDGIKLEVRVPSNQSYDEYTLLHRLAGAYY